MPTNVLIVNYDAAEIRDLLKLSFPDLTYTLVEDDVVTADHVADADVMISRGRWFSHDLLDRSARLKWFQCLITGVDHLLPVLAGSKVLLTNARGIHGPADVGDRDPAHAVALPEHAADRAQPGRPQSGAHRAEGARPAHRGDRRRRRDRRAHRETLQGVRHEDRRRDRNAAAGRRLRPHPSAQRAARRRRRGRFPAAASAAHAGERQPDRRGGVQGDETHRPL